MARIFLPREYVGNKSTLKERNAARVTGYTPSGWPDDRFPPLPPPSTAAVKARTLLRRARVRRPPRPPPPGLARAGALPHATSLQRSLSVSVCMGV
eukprot:COSAG01_NODE_19379_length_1013_cov_1.095186_1_plen_95_part_10